MIPKKIHYCWFGGNPLPESFQICLASWKKYLPDYEIIEWNETNFDIHCCEYVRKAAENRKWAFVSDYARAKALHEQGGIYMDIDVEVKHNLDEFLCHRAFSGFEIVGSPFTALWAAELGHPWPKKVLDFYHGKEDFDLTTNTVFVSELLKTELHRLKTKDRPEVINAIAEARAQGDLSENAEYDAAKDALVFIYGTLAERHGIIEKYLRYKLMLGDEKPKPTLHSQRKE